jgi:hypothetical protein
MVLLLHKKEHLFLCNKNFQKEKDEGKAILLPASCDAGKNCALTRDRTGAMWNPKLGV